MNHRRKGVLFILLGVGALGLSWMALSPREPVYQGKPLSVWLEQLEVHASATLLNPAFYDGPMPDTTREEAEKAVRQIGPKALPTLLSMLRSKDSSLKRKLARLEDEHWLFRFRITPADVQRGRAVLGFQMLGQAAKPAIPMLIDLLSDPECSNDVAAAVVWIGPVAVPPLIDALRGQEGLASARAADALGALAVESHVTIPALLARLASTNNPTRGRAACALGGFGGEAQVAIPTLKALLETENAPEAACGLAGIGDEGIHVLTVALSSTNRAARAASAGALDFLTLEGGRIKPRGLNEYQGRLCLCNAKVIRMSWAMHSGKEAPLIVPALQPNLRNTNAHVRVVTAEALGRFGQQAKTAVPDLRKAQADPDPAVRAAATLALREIEPTL